MSEQTWDPSDTLRRTLWIGGAQWAGKSTVARILAHRHGLTAYHYDYHDARGHQDRRIARRVALGQSPESPYPDTAWLETTPEDLAARTLAGFPDRFEWVLDDLRALYSPRPIIAEGWGLRPELVAPLLETPNRMVVMVPTEDFRQHQLSTLPRAAAMGTHTSDPARAQANRVARDRLVAEDAVRQAEAQGIRVIEVDGSRDAFAIADEVSGCFGEALTGTG
jgi:2-phosphoglycerate kinase